MEGLEFITWEELLEEHRNQLRLYGGQDGFIDEGVVRSAMNRAQFSAIQCRCGSGRSRSGLYVWPFDHAGVHGREQADRAERGVDICAEEWLAIHDY